MRVKDMTQRVRDAWEYYDAVLSDHIKQISDISGVPETQMVKINPAEFIEKNRYQRIKDYKYQKIENWIEDNKKDEHIFLISPEDAIEETAAQISYKQNTQIERTIRASKCEIQPISAETAKDFFIRNHRQSVPQVKETAVIYGLVYNYEVVAVMHYDISNGAVRGGKTDYELVRLAISKGTKVHGGQASFNRPAKTP